MACSPDKFILRLGQEAYLLRTSLVIEETFSDRPGVFHSGSGPV